MFRFKIINKYHKNLALDDDLCVYSETVTNNFWFKRFFKKDVIYAVNSFNIDPIKYRALILDII